MNALLIAINSKYTHTNLAVRSLRANAGHFRDSVHIKEFTINQSVDYALQEIYRSAPDLLAFSCYLWNITQVLQLCRELHTLLPEVPIWLGGPEATYNGTVLLNEHSEITGVMLGEGEETFRELLTYYHGQPTELANIAGLLVRGEDGTPTPTSPRPPLSMDLLAFPYDETENLSHRILYYETSRGCPFSCSYCLSSADHHLRFKSLEKVYPELQYFLDHKVPQVKFVDRTFNSRRDHAMGILQYLREHDNGVTNFHFEIAADLLTQPILQLLRTLRPGQVQLEIGVQTTNPGTLVAIHRTSDYEKLAQVCTTLRQMNNLHMHLDLIAGLPGEDFASFLHSFDDVYALKPHQLQLGFLKVLSGTDLAAHSELYGIRYRQYPPYEVLYTADISYEELCRLKSMEQVLELYYNSGQFTVSLPYLETHFPTASRLYLHLGEYYDSRSADGAVHSRMTRYQILLDFAMTLGLSENETAFFKELLIYDLYLREKLKSRPAYAPCSEETLTQARRYREATRSNSAEIKKSEHLEVFRFHIPAWIEERRLLHTSCCLCFSYEHRDPITGNAHVRELPLLLDEL